MTRSTRIAVTALTALAVVAPAAQAKPATEPVQSKPSAMTVGQLHRVDGGQPVSLAPDSAVEITTLGSPVASPDGNGSPWIFVAAPLTLLVAAGAARKATKRTFVPRRHAHAA
jgi:hypothetical protein